MGTMTAARANKQELLKKRRVVQQSLTVEEAPAAKAFDQNMAAQVQMRISGNTNQPPQPQSISNQPLQMPDIQLTEKEGGDYSEQKPEKITSFTLGLDNEPKSQGDWNLDADGNLDI